MRAVKKHLVTGISMNCGHDASLDGSILVESLSHRSEAVGGAGCSRDDLVIRGKGVVVGVEDDGLEVRAGRSGDNDLLGTSVDVSLSLSLRGVETGALKYNVYAKLAPGKVLCVLLAVDLDFLAVNNDGILFCLDLVPESISALSGIILQKLSKHFRVGEIVDGNDVIALSFEHLSECETSDAAETIDSNFNHSENLH